jgi:hypothetical protein
MAWYLSWENMEFSDDGELISPPLSGTFPYRFKTEGEANDFGDKITEDHLVTNCVAIWLDDSWMAD